MRLLQLTPLTSHFLAEIVQLDQQCFGGLWSRSAYTRELDSPNSIVVGLVDTKTNATSADISSIYPPTSPRLLAMGCLWAICEEAHVTILAVHPQYRRQGMGQMVLGEMLRWAQRHGQEWATLEVSDGNAAALKVYSAFGFEAVGRRPRYYADKGDALILWRKGLQMPEFSYVLEQLRQHTMARLAQCGWLVQQQGR